MLGIQGPTDLTLEYCCRLVKEYTALDCAQLFSILRRYGRMNYAKRSKLANAMCHGQYAKKIAYEGRTYFISRPMVRIEGRLREQVRCFWVLMDYLDRVDRHYASGTESSAISMEIEGRDYSILYAEKGKERLCSYRMEVGGVTRYFILVEDLEQIPLIKGKHIHAFALLDGKNAVHYYSPS